MSHFKRQAEGKATAEPLHTAVNKNPLSLPHHNISQGPRLHLPHVIIDHRDWWRGEEQAIHIQRRRFTHRQTWKAMIFKHPAGDCEQLLRFTHSCFFWVFRRLLNCGEAILTESVKTMAKQRIKTQENVDLQFAGAYRCTLERVFQPDLQVARASSPARCTRRWWLSRFLMRERQKKRSMRTHVCVGDLWCFGESTRASNVRCDAKILTQPPCFGDFHASLHKELVRLPLWAALTYIRQNYDSSCGLTPDCVPQPGCAPLPAESRLFVVARTPGGRITRSIRLGKRDYIRNHTAADEPRVQQAVSEKHLFCRWVFVLFLGVNKRTKTRLSASICPSFCSFSPPSKEFYWTDVSTSARTTCDRRQETTFKTWWFQSFFYSAIIFYTCLSAHLLIYILGTTGRLTLMTPTQFTNKRRLKWSNTLPFFSFTHVLIYAQASLRKGNRIIEPIGRASRCKCDAPVMCSSWVIVATSVMAFSPLLVC